MSMDFCHETHAHDRQSRFLSSRQDTVVPLTGQHLQLPVASATALTAVDASTQPLMRCHPNQALHADMAALSMHSWIFTRRKVTARNRKAAVRRAQAVSSFPHDVTTLRLQSQKGLGKDKFRQNRTLSQHLELGALLLLHQQAPCKQSDSLGLPKCL